MDSFTAIESTSVTDILDDIVAAYIFGPWRRSEIEFVHQDFVAYPGPVGDAYQVYAIQSDLFGDQSMWVTTRRVEPGFDLLPGAAPRGFRPLQSIDG